MTSRPENGQCPVHVARTRRSERTCRARRLDQLAGLVTHKENGRFARTIVNRLWEPHSAASFIPSTSWRINPGATIFSDYLAVYLVDHNYDLKKAIEHVVTSRTYQSQHVPSTTEPAAESYVFEGPGLKLLTAEEFFDAIWMITRTGPTNIKTPFKRPPNDAAAPPEREFFRGSLAPSSLLMRSLGRPNREQVVTTRPSLITTLQALDLANGQALYDMLAHGSANLLKADASDAARLVDSLYVQALCRHPNGREMATARNPWRSGDDRIARGSALGDFHVARIPVQPLIWAEEPCSMRFHISITTRGASS